MTSRSADINDQQEHEQKMKSHCTVQKMRRHREGFFTVSQFNHIFTAK